MLKAEFEAKIQELGFGSPQSFVESVIDLSMQPGNWRSHKICGLKDIYFNYPKVYSGYLDARKASKSISSF